MAWGLWTSAPWARLAQLAFSGVGVFTCALTLPSLATLAYMLRDDAKRHFAGEPALGDGQGQSELTFTLGIVGSARAAHSASVSGVASCTKGMSCSIERRPAAADAAIAGSDSNARPTSTSPRAV